MILPALESIDFLKLRKNKHLTQRQVEELTGISNAYLSQLETGKIKAPSYTVVRTLVHLYTTQEKPIFKTVTRKEMSGFLDMFGGYLIEYKSNSGTEQYECTFPITVSEKVLSYFGPFNRFTNLTLHFV